MNPTQLANQRMTASEEIAQERFAEATRSATFSINLGIREVRLLAQNDWTRLHTFTPSELAAYHKLLDRGLLIREDNELPRLSEAGELMRRMLVLSKHITLPTKVYKAQDVLTQVQHAISWYGANGMTAGSRLSSRVDKDAEGVINGLIVRTEYPDYDVRVQSEHLRPRKVAEYKIALEKVERTG